MDILETAKAHADAEAPAPADKPVAAALTATAFGLFVIGVFFAIRWFGAPEWVAWIAAAAIYGLVAYGDCRLGWYHHTRAFQQKLADLRADAPVRSLH